jgi:hypothetical protein
MSISCTADEAVARLIAGSERFVRGEARFTYELPFNFIGRSEKVTIALK